MGYQEAYVTTMKKNEFESFYEQVKSFNKDYFDECGSYPCEIITFTKNHGTFKKGDKAIYFCGERYPLRCFMVKDDYYNEKFVDNTFKLKIVYTEDVNPIGIWNDCGEVTDCIHEPFIE